MLPPPPLLTDASSLVGQRVPLPAPAVVPVWRVDADVLAAPVVLLAPVLPAHVLGLVLPPPAVVDPERRSESRFLGGCRSDLTWS